MKVAIPRECGKPLTTEDVSTSALVAVGGVQIGTNYADQIHGFAFMPAVIRAADDAITDIARLVHTHCTT